MIESNTFEINWWNMLVTVVQMMVAQLIADGSVGPEKGFWNINILVFVIVFLIIEVMIRHNYWYRKRV